MGSRASAAGSGDVMAIDAYQIESPLELCDQAGRMLLALIRSLQPEGRSA